MSLRSIFARKSLAYRVIPSLVALCSFFAFSALYLLDYKEIYFAILSIYGIFPFRFPFLDISGSLAVWDCTRLGIDVVVQDPCDVLGRGYNYSPLWMAASFIPLGAGETAPVGWVLGLLFILSLTLVPPARRPWELVLVVLATNSTMVVFAVERANPDIILFMMALAAGLLARGPLPVRILGYLTALLAAMIKYYPITLLILLFRERVAGLFANSLAMAVLLALFFAVYLPDVMRGVPLIASGPYFFDLFAAKNLPLGLAQFTFQPGGPTDFSFTLLGSCIYALLVLGGVLICRRILSDTTLRSTFFQISDYERIFAVVGSALIVGCFFAGQSIGYRGIFLLFILPGLLAITRVAPDLALRRLCRTAAIVMVLLMWEECFRLGLGIILGYLDIPQSADNLRILVFWLARELAWWWLVSVMVAFLLVFLAESETVRTFLELSKRYLSAKRAR
jgi:hypothetical protein